MPIHIGSLTVTGQREYANEDTPFDVTLAVAGTAEDAVVPPATKVGRRISIVNHGPGKAYIAFDGTATATSLVIDKGDSYDEADVAIATKVSFIGEVGKTPRVSGVLWSN